MANFQEPIKNLTKSIKHVRETFPVSPKLIIFNKSIMAKHPNIDLDTATVFKSILLMFDVLNNEP